MEASRQVKGSLDTDMCASHAGSNPAERKVILQPFLCPKRYTVCTQAPNLLPKPEASGLTGGTRNPSGNNTVMPVKSTLLCIHCLYPPSPFCSEQQKKEAQQDIRPAFWFTADGSLQPPRQLTRLDRSSEFKVRLNWTFIPSPSQIVLRPESNQENPGPTRDPV